MEKQIGGTKEPDPTKKEQKISISYTLKSLGANIDKIDEAKILKNEEIRILRELHERAVKYWIGLEFKFKK